MMFLKKMIVHNFQSHSHNELTFSEGLNMIVGPSDSGKTALIRAIKWVLYNEPSGDFFIKQGESESYVSLLFSNDITVTRYRSKSKNQYILKYEDGEELIFEGFGTSVPMEVVDAIGIYKVTFDTRDSQMINISEQLEGPFLLSERGSARANAIGKAVGVEKVDEALRETLRDLRSLQQSVKRADEKKRALELQLKEYDYLNEAEARLNLAKSAMKKVQDFKNVLSKSLTLKEDYDTTKKNIEPLLYILKKTDDIDSLEILTKNLKELIVFFNTLVELRVKKESISALLTKTLVYLNKSKSLDEAYLIFKNLDELISLYKTRERLLSRFTSLKVRIHTINQLLKNTSNNDLIECYLGSLTMLILNRKDKLEKYNSRSILTKRIENGYGYIAKFSNEQVCENIMKQVDTSIKKLHTIKNLASEHNNMVKNISKYKNEVGNLLLSIEEIKTNMKDSLDHLDVCPTCGSKIDDEHTDKILTSFFGGKNGF